MFEVLKANEDVTRLIQNGLLRSIEEVDEVVKRANIILRHICNEKCVVRIGPGDDPSNFRCRKLN